MYRLTAFCSYQLLVLLHFVGVAPLAAQVRHEYREVHMGMPVRLVLYAPTDSSARTAARAAFQRIAELDAQLSDYRADSEVRRIGRSAPEWVPVSQSTQVVLTRALGMARSSQGAFDPTVGPLVVLWRAARGNGVVPAPAQLDSARLLVDYNQLQIDSARGLARLGRAGMQLDLGGIAKGFILQEALHTLKRHAVTQVLLEAGGDIVAGAAPPGHQGWRITVPGADRAFQKRAQNLEHAALATSGPGAQFLEVNGARYSHVIDPRTGWALRQSPTAHVIARDGGTADALATALTVLPDEATRQALLAQFPDVVSSATVVTR